MKTERGDFHRKNQRGGSLPVVQGAVVQFKCTFCGKVFNSVVSAGQHESMKHKKLLKRIQQGS